MADYSEDVARYAADKAGADYDAAIAGGHTPQTIIQQSLAGNYVSNEDLGRYAADKSGADYDAAVAAGHTPETILQETAGYRPINAQPIDKSGDSALKTGAAITGAVLGTKAAIPTGTALAAKRLYDTMTSNAAGQKGFNPYGVQKYSDTQQGHSRPRSVSVPVPEFEKIAGQPINTMSGIQSFLAAAETPMGTPASQMTQLQKDYAALMHQYRSPVASPKAALDYAHGKLSSPFAMPVAGAISGYELQDAINRFKANEDLQGYSSLAGGTSAAATPFLGRIPRVGKYLQAGAATLSGLAPALNMAADKTSVFDNPANLPHKAGGGSMDDDAPFDPMATYADNSPSALSQIKQAVSPYIQDIKAHPANLAKSFVRSAVASTAGIPVDLANLALMPTRAAAASQGVNIPEIPYGSSDIKDLLPGKTQGPASDVGDVTGMFANFDAPLYKGAKAAVKNLGPKAADMIEASLRAKGLMPSIMQESSVFDKPVDRINMNYKDVTKRIPELTDAAKQISSGNMTSAQYQNLVDQFKPVTPYSSVPQPEPFDKMFGALHEDKKGLLGTPRDLPEGHQVGIRLDIPAYTDHGTWVPAIHERGAKSGMAGPRIGYDSHAHITDADFAVAPKAAENYATGKTNKSTFATISGGWKPSTPEQAYSNAQQYLNHPDWIQVGMDPERHSFFYDRATQQPVKSAAEVLQVGPLVLARNPVYHTAEEASKFKYADGGEVAEMKAALKMKNGGLYENIHAKQERIAHGSGEHMRKFGSEGAPSEQDFIESAKTAKMKDGGPVLSVGRGEKLPVSQGAGLTAKGREKYNRETGSHLQAPQPEGGARKDSFCARMQGVVDHAKGDAERAKASLKRWKC